MKELQEELFPPKGQAAPTPDVPPELKPNKNKKSSKMTNKDGQMTHTLPRPSAPRTLKHATEAKEFSLSEEAFRPEMSQLRQEAHILRSLQQAKPRA